MRTRIETRALNHNNPRPTSRILTLALLLSLGGCLSDDGSENGPSNERCPNPVGVRLTLGAQDYCGLDLNDLRNIRVYADRETETWTTERSLNGMPEYTQGQYNSVDDNACRVSVIDQFNRKFRVDAETTVDVTVSYDVELGTEDVFGIAQVRARCSPSGACGNGYVGGECVFTANVDGSVYCIGEGCIPLGQSTGSGGNSGSGGMAGTGGSAGVGGMAGSGGMTGASGSAGVGGMAGSGGMTGAGGSAGVGGMAGSYPPGCVDMANAYDEPVFGRNDIILCGKPDVTQVTYGDASAMCGEGWTLCTIDEVRARNDECGGDLRFHGVVDSGTNCILSHHNEPEANSCRFDNARDEPGHTCTGQRGDSQWAFVGNLGAGNGPFLKGAICCRPGGNSGAGGEAGTGGTAGTTGAPAECEAGWTETAEGDRCRRVFTDRKTWSAARASCAEQNSHLATVRSDSDNEALRTLVGLETDQHPNYFIGLSDAAQEGVWQWEDGSSPSEFFWLDSENEPNGGVDENCVGVARSSGMWMDLSCDTGVHQELYVCEYTLNNVSIPNSDWTEVFRADFTENTLDGMTTCYGCAGTGCPMANMGALQLNGDWNRLCAPLNGLNASDDIRVEFDLDIAGNGNSPGAVGLYLGGTGDSLKEKGFVLYPDGRIVNYTTDGMNSTTTVAGLSSSQGHWSITRVANVWSIVLNNQLIGSTESLPAVQPSELPLVIHNFESNNISGTLDNVVWYRHADAQTPE